jgi:enamine deaminase RidA (YjgF/YER057c/UK114 family)
MPRAPHQNETVLTTRTAGFDPQTQTLPPGGAVAESAQAFKNVETTLKVAGRKGWSQVFKVVAFFGKYNDENLAIFMKEFEKWCPDHKPILSVYVVKLVMSEMSIQLEVTAHDPVA